MAARVATLPDAQAASWRDAGVSHSPSLTLAGIAPRWPWRANISPKALATWTTSMSAASTLAAASVLSTTSAVRSAKSRPSRVKLRAKSL